MQMNRWKVVLLALCYSPKEVNPLKWIFFFHTYIEASFTSKFKTVPLLHILPWVCKSSNYLKGSASLVLVHSFETVEWAEAEGVKGWGGGWVGGDDRREDCSHEHTMSPVPKLASTLWSLNTKLKGFIPRTLRLPLRHSYEFIFD